MLQDVSPHGYKKEKNCNTNQKPNSLDPQCNLELSGVVAFHTHFGSFVLIKVLIRSSSLICEEYLSSNASMNSTIQFYPKIASLKLHYNFKCKMHTLDKFLEWFLRVSSFMVWMVANFEERKIGFRMNCFSCLLESASSIQSIKARITLQIFWIKFKLE